MKKAVLCWALVSAFLVSGCQEAAKHDSGPVSVTADNYSKLLEKPWVLQSLKIDDQAYSLVKEVPFIRFSVDHRINGFTSINQFFVGLEIDADGQVAWPNPAGSTRMAGPPVLMKQEAAFMKALPQTARMTASDVQLVMTSADGRTELVFAAQVQ